MTKQKTLRNIIASMAIGAAAVFGGCDKKIDYRYSNLMEKNFTCSLENRDGYLVRITDFEGIKRLEFYDKLGKLISEAASLEELTASKVSNRAILQNAEGIDSNGKLFLKGSEKPLGKSFDEYNLNLIEMNLPKEVYSLKIYDKAGNVRTKKTFGDKITTGLTLMSADRE